MAPLALSKARALVAPKWLNGTVLRYGVLGPSSGYRAMKTDELSVFKAALERWTSLAPGLRFEPTADARLADIRVGSKLGFSTDCELGRDARNLADPDKATLRFGLLLTAPEGLAFAVHELGHACGFRHEHQTPDAGLGWDMDALRNHFSGWDDARIERSVTRPNPCGRLVGPPLDPVSVMGYPLPPGMALSPDTARTAGFTPGDTPSAVDRMEFKAWYPGLDLDALPALPLGQSAPLSDRTGAQTDYELVVPQSGIFEIGLSKDIEAVAGVRWVNAGQLEEFPSLRPDLLTGPTVIRLQLNAGYRFVLSVRTVHAGSGTAPSVSWAAA